ncbi:hypothetical protein BN938_0430 [Mucinivorans hirudinis]|uniref:Uncharacterized protein n=1 Tax=Mucinivorans hirudinis TaxID=1433126 RepID=A0A060R6D6_9BACT|nr:hypothetical protein BN938_0430 [Mucinivorans hirudinis]
MLMGLRVKPAMTVWRFCFQIKKQILTASASILISYKKE